MASTDNVINIDSTYTDSDGNYILGSDTVTSTFYYDTTVTGSESAWTKSWDLPNPFSNFDISTTTSGTWAYSTDDTATPYKHHLFRMPWFGDTDLLANKAVTSSGFSGGMAANNLVNIGTANGWWTPNATYQNNSVTVDIGASSSLTNVSIIPGFSTDYTNWVKEYRIGLSNTNNDWDFRVVASGVTTSGILEPINAYVGEETARYVRFYADSNWGGASYISVGKMHAYNGPSWSLFGYKEVSEVGGDYGQMSQYVDVTGIDIIYVDLSALMSSATQDGVIEFYLDGSLVSSTLNYSSTLGWVDSNDSNRWRYREYPVDVSAYSGVRQFKVKYSTAVAGNTRQYFYFAATNFSSQPRWFYEGLSSVRGVLSEFPTRVYIVADTEGLSILNSSDNKLWMRFNVGFGYALEDAPTGIHASNGCIWVTTSVGLYRIDFNTNTIYRYNESGIYYRPSIGRRNEYSKWRLLTTAITTNSSFFRCISGGTYLGNDFVVVGTSAGLVYIQAPFVGASDAYLSSYTYDITSVSSTDEKVVFVVNGGTSSRVGYYDSIGDLLSENFSMGDEVFSSDGLPLNFSLTEQVPEQLEAIGCGSLVPLVSTNSLTISGIKSSPGFVGLVSDKFPSRPFDIYLSVKLNDWVDRCAGGMHIGAGSALPYMDDSFYSGYRNSYSLSATNLTTMPVVQNDGLVTQVYDRWVRSTSSNTTSVGATGWGVWFAGYTLLGGTSAQYGPLVGSYLPISTSVSFVARVKVRVDSMPTGITAGRFKSVVFGVSNSSGGSSSTSSTVMGFTYHTASINPAAYNTLVQSAINTWTNNVTETVSAFSGDGSGSAAYHQWEISYNTSSGVFSCSVDGTHIRTFTNSVGSNVHIIFGFKESDNSTASLSSYFKDFEIDFGLPTGNISRKYCLVTHNSTGGSKPTVSGGTHLDGVQFDSTDGTSGSAWHLWHLSYDGSDVTAYIDGGLVGSVVGASFGSYLNFFAGYDMPVTSSGVSSVNVEVRDFRVDFDQSYTVASGGVNDVRLNSGNYVDTPYDTVFMSTTSGLNVCMYSTSLAGRSDINYDYGVTGSNMVNEVLYGSVKSVSKSEPDAGVVGPMGLLYVGTSNYGHGFSYWDKWVNRPGEALTTSRGNLGVSYLGDKAYYYYNETSPKYVTYGIDLESYTSRWLIIGCNNQCPGYASIGTTRGFYADLGCGDTYVIGPSFMSYFDSNYRWSQSNMGTGVVSISTGASLGGGEVSIGVSRGELFLSYTGPIGKFKSEWLNWEGDDLYVGSSPFGAVDSCIVYSEADNALYVWFYGTSSNFYKILVDQRRWVGPLDDPPIPYDITTGIYGFYRPYDECLYFLVSKYNKVLKYDVKAGSWTNFGAGWFYSSATVNNMSAAYSPVTDTVYFSYGIDTLSAAKYRFNKTGTDNFVTWEPSYGCLPEACSGRRFNKVSFGSGKWVGSDAFDDSVQGGFWYDSVNSTPDKTSVTETDSLSVQINNATFNGVSTALRTTAAVLPNASFSVSLNVKIKAMPVPNTGSSFNSFVFGVTDYFGTVAYDTSKTNAGIGETLVGVNGLWMTAYNTQALSNRYSLWKREDKTDTRYGATIYSPFNATDGTAGAGYRVWRIDYNHVSSTLTAYIDGVLLGSVALSGGFKHGLHLSLGGFCYNTSSSGELDVEVADLVINDYNTNTNVAGYMTMSSQSYCGDNYYERYDCTLTSGIDLGMEIEAKFDSYATSGGTYVCTLAGIENGDRLYTLNALYDGSKKLGVYTGGDPSLLSSYSPVISYDWSTQSLYSLNIDSDNDLQVSIAGVPYSSLSTGHDVLPQSNTRRVFFGKTGLSKPIVRSVLDRHTSTVVVSGTWSSYTTTTADGSYCRFYKGVSAGSTSNSITFNFGNLVGEQSVYVFYAVGAGMSADAPITIYHSGIVDLPVSDSFATNPIASVSDNINESGVADLNTTTVDISQQRFCDGSTALGTYTKASGWVYLGRYTNVSKAVVTGGGTANLIQADTFKVVYNDEPPYSTFSAKIYKVGYGVGSSKAVYSSDTQAGFSIVNLSTGELVDYYSMNTNPSILGDNVIDLDIVI